MTDEINRQPKSIHFAVLRNSLTLVVVSTKFFSNDAICFSYNDTERKPLRCFSKQLNQQTKNELSLILKNKRTNLILKENGLIEYVYYISVYVLIAIEFDNIMKFLSSL